MKSDKIRVRLNELIEERNNVIKLAENPPNQSAEDMLFYELREAIRTIGATKKELMEVLDQERIHAIDAAKMRIEKFEEWANELRTRRSLNHHNGALNPSISDQIRLIEDHLIPATQLEIEQLGSWVIHVD